jgi:hypothetical protein
MGLLGAGFIFICCGTSAVFGVFQFLVCWVKDIISILVYVINTKRSDSVHSVGGTQDGAVCRSRLDFFAPETAVTAVISATG